MLETGSVERTDRDVGEFLASFDGEVAETMAALDALLRRCLPGRVRQVYEGVFWGGTDQVIVGYGDLRQPRPRGEPAEWFVVGLARQSATYSLYVNAVADGDYLLRAYEGRLGKVKLGSASVGFTALGDVDLDVLAELLERAHALAPPDGEPPS